MRFVLAGLSYTLQHTPSRDDNGGDRPVVYVDDVLANGASTGGFFNSSESPRSRFVCKLLFLFARRRRWATDIALAELPMELALEAKKAGGRVIVCKIFPPFAFFSHTYMSQHSRDAVPICEVGNLAPCNLLVANQSHTDHCHEA